MLSPIDRSPPSCAPRLPASMIPGPPPVMITKPASAKSRAVCTAASYIGSSSSTRADPKIVTAGPVSSASVSKPSTNSPMMRSTRQGSLCVNSFSAGCSVGVLRNSSSCVGRPVRAARLSDASRTKSGRSRRGCWLLAILLPVRYRRTSAIISCSSRSYAATDVFRGRDFAAFVRVHTGVADLHRIRTFVDSEEGR